MASLNNLGHIEANNNKIVDISALANLTNINKIYLNNNIYILNIYFKEYKELLVLYLNKIIPQNNINKIKLFGNNKNIKDIMSYLNHILDLDIYIYSYSSVFPLNLLT